MLPALPLDDLIGRTLFIEGAPWRFTYVKTRRRFALQRLAASIDFDVALDLIANGEMLWAPPEKFEALRADLLIEEVQQHLTLLDAYRRSPSYTEARDRALPARVDARIAECRAWLTRRALAAGDGES